MSGPFNVIPIFAFGPSQSTAPAGGLNASATSVAEQQLTLAAIDAPLRFGYGRAPLGALIAAVVTWGTELVLLCVHGKGPIDAVESVSFDNGPAPGGVQVTHYLGNAGQGVDPWLQAAFAAQGKVYADALPGIAYSVLRIPANPDASFDGISFVVRLLKIYEPRGTPTTAWSENPALALADFITNTQYGRGELIDWASVATCADKCDELVGGAKRRTLSLVLNAPRDVDQWEKTLETYAGAWAVREGGTVYLVPDAPAATVLSFTKARYRLETLDIEVRNRAKAPTVVTVRYTNAAVTPWASASVTVKIAGVDAGTLPYQESVVDLPGIISDGHALREAYRRLYEAQLADVAITFTALDEGLKVRKYDVVDYTDDEGFAAKPFRVIDAAIAEPGRWLIKAVEYQAGVYSNATASPPTIGDTVLPNPNAPPPPASVTAVEEIFQFQSFGQYGSRLKVTITPNATFPYAYVYAVEVLAGTDLVYRVDAPHASPAVVRTPAIQEGIAYTVSVVTVSTTGARSAAVTAVVTAEGKQLPPEDIPAGSFEGFEIGGEVLLKWGQVNDIDKVRYEVRWGATTDAWDATPMDNRAVYDTTRAALKGIASGTYRFQIKAIDSVGLYSATARTVDIAITLDSGAFVLTTYRFTTITGANTYGYKPENPSAETWYHVSNGIVASGREWNALFTGTVNSYTSPLESYQSSGATEIEGITNAFDFGVVVSGNVSASWATAVLDGAARTLIGLSTDGAAYTYVEAAAVQGSFRFVKLKIAATGDTIVQGLPRIQISIVSREESGQVRSSASTYTLVELANAYFGAQDLQLTPLVEAGTPANISAVYDDLQLATASARAARLRFTGAGSYGYSYRRLLPASSPTYTIQAGDVLKCEAYLDSSCAAAGAVVGVSLVPSAGTTCNAHAAINAFGVWTAVATALNANTVGATISAVQLEMDTVAPHTGVWTGFVRNVRIEDGSGNVRKQLWQSGDVDGSDYSTVNVTSVTAKPMNTFKVYCLNSTDTKVARDVRWIFKGV